MRILLTGDLGFSADAEEVFGELDTKLLLATVLLVLVLLGAIYRAVLVALTPADRRLLRLHGRPRLHLPATRKSGATVSSNATTILIVLMFGVGTDYCLLLVSRYREELRRIEDKHEAMARAVRRAGPGDPRQRPDRLARDARARPRRRPQHQHPRARSPRSASSAAMVAGLTLLPALLTIFGRRGFWPRRGIVEYDPDHAAVDARQGLWRRVGDRVLQRPGAGAGGHRSSSSSAAPSACSPTRSTTRRPPSSRSRSTASRASSCSRRRSRPGRPAPTTALVQSDDGTAVTEAQIADATRGDRGRRGRRQRRRRPGGPRPTATSRRLDIVLEDDPFTKDALDVVPDIRASVGGPRRRHDRAGRRRHRDPVRLRRGDRERPEADRARSRCW